MATLTPLRHEILDDIEKQTSEVLKCEQALREAEATMNRTIYNANCLGVDFNAISYRVRRALKELDIRQKTMNERIRVQQRRFRVEHGLKVCNPKKRTVVEEEYEMRVEDLISLDGDGE